MNSVGESASRQREIILRNNGPILALGHSQSTEAETVLIVPRMFAATELRAMFMRVKLLKERTQVVFTINRSMVLAAVLLC